MGPSASVSGFLCATAGEADDASHSFSRAPAINDDNFNFDTLAFAEAARLDKLRKSPYLIVATWY